jgi:F-type H+-transporting ATPase subunit b
MKRIRTGILTASLTMAAFPAFAEDAAHESSGGLPQFDPQWWPSQIFWLAVCFFFLYAVLSAFVLPAIGGTLETRRQKVEGDLANAEQLKNQAEAARKSYETGLDNARAEAVAIIATAHQSIKTKAESQATAFRDSMELQMDALSKRLDKAKAGAMNDMNSIAADIAREAALKIVGISFDAKKAQTVVEALNREAA